MGLGCCEHRRSEHAPTECLSLPLPRPDGGGVAQRVGGRRGSSLMSDAKDYRVGKQASARAKDQAISLRSEMSPPERILWSAIRGKKIAGLRFRKQAPIGSYIADFYCHEARLVVEVDGRKHQGAQKEHDQTRDRWMAERGILVLRVRALDVFENLEGVTRTIVREAEKHLEIMKGSQE